MNLLDIWVLKTINKIEKLFWENLRVDIKNIGKRYNMCALTKGTMRYQK